MVNTKPTVSTSNLNQINAYTYDDKTRYNIPPVGLAQYDAVASREAKYEYDPYIAPCLLSAGRPEMIKEFRNIWELGIYSYLNYLQDRLLHAKLFCNTVYLTKERNYAGRYRYI